jgi:hypothetical protein
MLRYNSCNESNNQQYIINGSNHRRLSRRGRSSGSNGSDTKFRDKKIAKFPNKENVFRRNFANDFRENEQKLSANFAKQRKFPEKGGKCVMNYLQNKRNLNMSLV